MGKKFSFYFQMNLYFFMPKVGDFWCSCPFSNHSSFHCKLKNMYLFLHLFLIISVLKFVLFIHQSPRAFFHVIILFSFFFFFQFFHHQPHQKKKKNWTSFKNKKQQIRLNEWPQPTNLNQIATKRICYQTISPSRTGRPTSGCKVPQPQLNQYPGKLAAASCGAAKRDLDAVRYSLRRHRRGGHHRSPNLWHPSGEHQVSFGEPGKMDWVPCVGHCPHRCRSRTWEPAAAYPNRGGWYVFAKNKNKKSSSWKSSLLFLT